MGLKTTSRINYKLIREARAAWALGGGGGARWRAVIESVLTGLDRCGKQHLKRVSEAEQDVD